MTGIVITENQTITIVNDVVNVITIAEQGPAGPVKHNIDGGNADSVYLVTQVIDGGIA